MKFNNLLAFEKHLSSAKPDHLCGAYLIIDSEGYAQQKMAKLVMQPHEHWKEHHCEDISQAQLSEIFNDFSMFEPVNGICLLGVDKLSKSSLSYLAKQLLGAPLNFRVVVTASASVKELTPVGKEGVVLDLCQEKPWDKEKRLSQYVMREFHQQGVRSAASICDQLVKLCGGSLSRLDQEIEKLCCYLGDRKEVQRQDLDLVITNPQWSIFKIGQKLFEGNVKEALSILHAQQFPLMMLIYALRSTVQRCYRIKAVKPSELNQYLPDVKGYLLEKNQQLAAKYSLAQWKKMLHALFEVEFTMKNQSLKEELLASLLITKIGAILR